MHWQARHHPWMPRPPPLQWQWLGQRQQYVGAGQVTLGSRHPVTLHGPPPCWRLQRAREVSEALAAASHHAGMQVRTLQPVCNAAEKAVYHLVLSFPVN